MFFPSSPLPIVSGFNSAVLEQSRLLALPLYSSWLLCIASHNPLVIFPPLPLPPLEILLQKFLMRVLWMTNIQSVAVLTFQNWPA